MVQAVADVMPHITGALLLAVVFMALGIFIKRMWLKNTIVPPSLIAGAIALAVGPQGFGQLLGGADWQPNWLPAGVIPETIIAVWSELPGPLITVVFASLFIGRKIPSVKEIWSESAPNLAYGYSLAFGQYTAGLFIGCYFNFYGYVCNDGFTNSYWFSRGARYGCGFTASFIANR
jgi:Na+/glutamate symporter